MDSCLRHWPRSKVIDIASGLARARPRRVSRRVWIATSRRVDASLPGLRSQGATAGIGRAPDDRAAKSKSKSKSRARLDESRASRLLPPPQRRRARATDGTDDLRPSKEAQTRADHPPRRILPLAASAHEPVLTRPVDAAVLRETQNPGVTQPRAGRTRGEPDRGTSRSSGQSTTDEPAAEART